MRRRLTIIATLLALVTSTALAAGEQHESAPIFATMVQSQMFKIAGDAGRRWTDTGIDVRPGDLFSLDAQGKVDYGESGGTWGPEGTAKFSGADFPAETAYRYGLVARITSSRTNSEDDLREDHAYGEGRAFCARAPGRLWLTANDNEPKDNKGEYIVTIKLSSCDPHPAPTSDPGRGVFRVKIVGFRVEHVVQDGLLDAGDDAYVMWDAAELNADGRFTRDHLLSGQSLVYGDSGRRRTRVRAGSQGANGGLKNGDEVVGRSAPSAERFPLLVGDFELVNGQNAVIFAPTIWLAQDDPGVYPYIYRNRFQGKIRFAACDVREILERNFSQFHWRSSLARSADNWFDMTLYGRARTDRPVGVNSSHIPDEPSDLIYDFVPHTFLLTYKSVTDLIRSAGGGLSQTWVPFEADYDDSGPHGAYQIQMTIERLR
jgi:hypothetical protein